MNSEIERFMKVWISAILCQCYCYYIASKVPKGFLRLLSIIPILYLFIILPLNLSSPNLGGYTAFFLTWLGTFKLILFSFNQGPLALSPNIVHFISIASLPITPKQHLQPNQNNTNTTQNPKWLLALKLLLLAMIVHVSHDYNENLHPHFMLVLYCFYLYLGLELTLLLVATTVRSIFGFEFEPLFNEPYLCSSLQDFWGHRWNLIVARILRRTIYDPIRRMFTNFVGPLCAMLAAMLATFLVSGLMHELMYYYLTRAPPTWEVTCFFVVHGVCTTMEVAMKKVMLHRRWRLHRAVSGALVLVFLVVTARWLFFPQLLRNGVDKKTIQEYKCFINCVLNSRLSYVYLSPLVVQF